ncbi:hypothetical protein DYU11_11535 [Fibrisoma montanum]|uniref:Uncharacterized protein n=1 Tax=Fibrisoma montanum TaxID=2305895 RepID=A0A418MBA3_9BACT|nr:hypothetical protein [Fibrisoma montanum]RIV23606.1 hypothetical protein DYU11_11535 [Fibrisoma montanum]
MRLLLLYLLAMTSALAQPTIRQRAATVNAEVYKGNPLLEVFVLPASVSDTTAVTVRVLNTVGGKLLGTQPTVERSGQLLRIRHVTSGYTATTYRTISWRGRVMIAGTVAADYRTVSAQSTQPYTVQTVEGDTVRVQVAGADAYSRSETYTRTEVDAVKPTLALVSTYAEAQLQAVAGKPVLFIIANDPEYGGSLTLWDGSDWFVSPLIPRN